MIVGVNIVDGCVAPKGMVEIGVTQGDSDSTCECPHHGFGWCILKLLPCIRVLQFDLFFQTYLLDFTTFVFSICAENLRCFACLGECFEKNRWSFRSGLMKEDHHIPSFHDGDDGAVPIACFGEVVFTHFKFINVPNALVIGVINLFWPVLRCGIGLPADVARVRVPRNGGPDAYAVLTELGDFSWMSVRKAIVPEFEFR